MGLSWTALELPLVPTHVACDDCAWLFEPNPDHPDNAGRWIERSSDLLLLGDSVAFGEGVTVEETFGALIGATVRASQGWSSYNERVWFQESDRSPADVVLAVCLNDVTNPRLHWGYTPLRFAIPDAAIPDLVDDRDRVQAIIGEHWGPDELARLGLASPLRSLTWVRRQLRGTPSLNDHVAALAAGTTGDHDQRTWPTLVTAEDTLDLRLLEDPLSAQWLWLTAEVTSLAATVAQRGGRVVVLLLPLAYQIDPAYPWSPQDAIMAWCDETGVPCVDPLPALREHGVRDVFQLDRSGYFDIWHLTALGHEVVGDVLAHHLPERSTSE